MVRRIPKGLPPKAMFVQIKTGSPSRGRSQERGKGDKICHKFQKDQCDKGKKCPYKHVVKDDKARTQSPRRNNTRSSSKGNKGDRGKKLSKEEMAKTPCIYHAQGTCNRGDKCYYQHDDKQLLQTKMPRKGLTLPLQRRIKNGKESNAAPCLVERCQKFACIAMTATSSSVSDVPVIW